MSLSKKLSELDGINQKKIEAQLQETFPNSVVVQVFFHVLGWMESEGINDVLNVSAHSCVRVLNKVISVLREKISKAEEQKERDIFEYLISSIQASYETNPIDLLNSLKEIHRFVENVVNKMLPEVVDLSQLTQEIISSLKAVSDQWVSNDDVREDESIDFTKEIGKLEILLKENDKYIEEIQKKIKERQIIQSLFPQGDLQIGKLQISNENYSNRPQNNVVDLSQLNQEIISSLKPLCRNISDLVYTKNKDIGDHIVNEILEWNYNKQRGQIGFPVYQSDYLQSQIPMFTKFTRILQETFTQIKKLVDILTQIGATAETQMQIEKMLCSSKNMLCKFLRSCFIFDEQPPQILLTDKIFNVSLRLLLKGQFLSTCRLSTVTCSLYLDDELRRLHDSNFQNIHVDEEKINNVKNNKKDFAYDRETDSFNVRFEKMSLNKPGKRKTKLGDDKTSKLVTDQKSCLLFQSQITIGSERFNIEAFSLPIVVIRNTSQYMESEATIFWDNAFAAKNRKPFITPGKVPLKEFLEALNNRWAKSNELELENHHLLYLAKKLFPDKSMAELDQCYVTKEMFHKNIVIVPQTRNGQTLKFTFWSWFYKAMNLVEKFMLNEWRDGKIYAFIDKREAEQKLNECLVGTFLFRFCDSIPGGISIAYKETMEGCSHMCPWNKDELAKISLSDSLRDLQYLKYLYPSTPKDQAFEKYYSKIDDGKTNDFDPRYPRKAPIRVVRHDDTGSSASNFSSTHSSASLQTSTPSVASRSEIDTDGDVVHLSPQSLPLEEDPFWSQGIFPDTYFSPDQQPRMDEMVEDFLI